MNGILDDFKNAFNKPNNGLIQIILINIIVFLLINALRLIFNWTGVSGYFDYVTDNLYLSSHVKTFLFPSLDLNYLLLLARRHFSYSYEYALSVLVWQAD